MFKHYKALLVILLPLLSVLSLSAQTISFSDSWDDAGFNLAKETNTEVEVVYSIEEFYFDAVDIKKIILFIYISINVTEGAELYQSSDI